MLCATGDAVAQLAVERRRLQVRVLLVVVVVMVIVIRLSEKSAHARIACVPV